MSARVPPPASKKPRLFTTTSQTTVVTPSSESLSPPPPPVFSSAPPATHTCYSAPPILFFPKPTHTAAPTRPASARSSRPSLHSASSAASTRPATARASTDEAKHKHFTASDFHVPSSYRPTSPRAQRHADWTSSFSNHNSTTCSSPRAYPHSSAVSEAEEADADSSSTVESLISPFFLPHTAATSTRPQRRSAPHFGTTSHSSYRTVATLPSADRFTHRQRFLHDNSFEQSFKNIIGSGGGVSDTGERSERDSNVATNECRSHLPGGSEYLLGKWKPVTRNGNELFARIVKNSKFHQASFV